MSRRDSGTQAMVFFPRFDSASLLFPHWSSSLMFSSSAESWVKTDLCEAELTLFASFSSTQSPDTFLGGTPPNPLGRLRRVMGSKGSLLKQKLVVETPFPYAAGFVFQSLGLVQYTSIQFHGRRQRLCCGRVLCQVPNKD
jgi:hypothetical protein